MLDMGRLKIRVPISPGLFRLRAHLLTTSQRHIRRPEAIQGVERRNISRNQAPRFKTERDDAVQPPEAPDVVWGDWFRQEFLDCLWVF